MDIRFVGRDLATLDAVRCEALLLPFTTDERPLQGALGLLDWRLCGFISQMLVTGKLSGSHGEVALIPTQRRVPTERLITFGLGRASELDAGRITETLSQMFEVARKSRSRSVAVVLPGRGSEQVSAAVAIEALLQLARHHVLTEDELVIIDSHEAQRAMEPILRLEKRRALADTP